MSLLAHPAILPLTDQIFRNPLQWGYHMSNLYLGRIRRDYRDGTIRCRHRVPENMATLVSSARGRQIELQERLSDPQNGDSLSLERPSTATSVASYTSSAAPLLSNTTPTLYLVPVANPLSTFPSISTRLLLSKHVLLASDLSFPHLELDQYQRLSLLTAASRTSSAFNSDSPR